MAWPCDMRVGERGGFAWEGLGRRRGRSCKVTGVAAAQKPSEGTPLLPPKNPSAKQSKARKVAQKSRTAFIGDDPKTSCRGRGSRGC